MTSYTFLLFIHAMVTFFFIDFTFLFIMWWSLHNKSHESLFFTMSFLIFEKQSSGFQLSSLSYSERNFHQSIIAWVGFTLKDSLLGLCEKEAHFEHWVTSHFIYMLNFLMRLDMNINVNLHTLSWDFANWFTVTILQSYDEI